MQSLLDHGWPQESLAFMDGMPLDEMKQVLGTWARDWELEDFEEVRQEAKRQKKKLDWEDGAYARNPVWFQTDKSWVDGVGHADLSDSARGVELSRARPFLPRAVWPTRFARRCAEEKDHWQRSKIEEKERDRLTQQLVVLLRKAGLLKIEETVGVSQAKQWLEKRHAMGRRPNTLRQHLRLGRKLSSYMQNAYGRPWFRSSGDVMEYVALRLEEPCGKTVPSSVWATIRFLEKSAEVPESARVSADMALQNFFSEVDRHPSWAEGHQKTSANRLVLSLVVAWEKKVVDVSEKKYIRAFSWFKLIKLWAALRWDDTMGIPPSSIQMLHGRGLRGKILRSKTTGEGRRVDVQEFYVAYGCWLTAPEWLEDGWNLFRDMGKDYGGEGRDFLLPRPDRRLSGFRGAMVRYGDAMSMARALTNSLKTVKDDGRQQDLVRIAEITGFWSEHSERVTAMSWAAALGVSPEARKRWGRWKPSTDEEYAKTSATLVMGAQNDLAEKLRAGLGHRDIVEDDLVLSSLGAWLEQRHFTEMEIDDQLRALRLHRGPRWKKLDGMGELAIPIAESEGEEEEGDHPPTTPVLEVGEEMDGLDLQVDRSEVLAVTLGTFVLSVVGRSKKRTLHRVGACYRIPGVHYKDFLVVGNHRPVLESGEKLCTSCFGKGDKLVAEANASASDLDSPSSVSSSTSLGSTSWDED